MPKEYPRSQRVGDQIQRELAELIRDELKDPRVGMVTVSAVEVSHDLAHAKVFITVLGTTENLSDPVLREATVAALGHAAGFLRHELGRRMRLRSVPQLHFVYDESVERGTHLSALIDAAVTADRRHPSDAEE